MTWYRPKIGLRIRIVGLIALIVVLALIAMQWRVKTRWADRRYASVAAVPVEAEPRVAIVFGAGVWASGEPSPVLYDRIATAVDLYRVGRVNKLLLSGDNRMANYNEPEAMRETAVKLGVPETDLVQDFAGRRTYDSCYRAREIFGVRRAVVVTQAFHLDRALYICNGLGIDSIGVAADRQEYGSARRSWETRELVSRVWAWGNINVGATTPILGEKEPIKQ
jgi:SanA protein